MKKAQLISRINKIIREYGSFHVSEIQSEPSITVASMGTFVSLAEHFEVNQLEAFIYDTSSMSDSIQSYIIEYKDLSCKMLSEILTLCELYETDFEKTFKRISN